MANNKAFKIKNGLEATRYLDSTSGLLEIYSGAEARAVFHYDMIASVFTADLQLDNINFDGTQFIGNSTPYLQTTTVDTSITNYSSASWSTVSTGTTGGRAYRDTGGTPSTGTGLTGGALGSSYYYYFETSTPANSADFDFLLRTLDAYTLSDNPTFTYYEARSGTSLGNLDVYLDIVSSPYSSVSTGLTSSLLQTTGDNATWVQKTVPMTTSTKIVDLQKAGHFTHTPTENITLVFERPPASGLALGFSIELVNTGGYSITWPSSVKWHEATTPTATSTKEVYTFITTDGGTTYYGKKAGENLA
tara:strand:+ start:4458 stop:5372 length:915 start_codon:yes stop_codon:yes gene_type:complete